MTTTGSRVEGWFHRLSPTMQTLVVIGTVAVVSSTATAIGIDYVRGQARIPEEMTAMKDEIERANAKVDSLRAEFDRFGEALLVLGSLTGRIEVVEKDLQAQRRRMTLLCLREGRSPEECVP